MAETAFGVVYDGPVLSDGRMPVRDLAPALLALGDLFVAASLAVHPEQEPVALNIKATAEGSFVVELIIRSPDAWDQIVHLFSSPPITALLNLKELVIGSGVGLFALIKRLHGQHVRDQEDVSPGVVRLTLDDGTKLEVPADAMSLYGDIEVRRKARAVVEPVDRPGVERVKFVSDSVTTLSIEESDLPAFDVPEPIVKPLTDQELEMTVAITSVTFVEGNKWRFSDGSSSFPAAIEDEDFLRRVELGEPFRKGDTLRCRMRITQSQHGGTLHTEYHVIHVLEHTPRAEQLSLDDEA